MRALLRLVLSRLVQGVILLLALSFASFGVMAHLPGDPVDLLVASNPALRPDDIARLRKLRGLDQPFPVRWWRWLVGYHEPVEPPPTIEAPAVVGALPVDDGGVVRPFVVDIPAPSPPPGCSLTPVPPLVEESGRFRALLVEPGATRLYAIVRGAVDAGVDPDAGDRFGEQEGLWSLPVYVAPPDPDALPPPGMNDPIVLDEAGAQLSGSTEEGRVVRTGEELRAAAVTVRPLSPIGRVQQPRLVGQHVVVEDQGVFLAVGDPLPGRFVCGVLCVALGDTSSLGWSWATKLPVAELLWGAEPRCGDGVREPGEGCDDGNDVDGDGCDRGCIASGASVLDRVDVAVAGALTSMGRVGNTLVLTTPALFLAMLSSLVLGAAAALRGGRVDVAVRVFASLCSSAPAFFVALLFISLFAEGLGWLPSGGVQSPGIHAEGAVAVLVDRARHLALPLTVLVLFWSGRFVRQVRSAVLSSSSSDFVRTARMKGASPLRVVVVHLLPNAALPLLTLVGLSLPSMFGGALLTETVFSWPGLGRLQYDAILQNDSYVAVVVFLLSAAMVLLGSLLADVAVFALDPRLRTPGARR